MRITIIGAVLLLVTLSGACADGQPAAGVDNALSQVVARDDLAGGVAVVRDGTGITRFSAGYSDVDTRAGFAPQTHVRAASITKTFVAATILQLVAEGRLDLDTSIETYLPGRIRGEGIDADGDHGATAAAPSERPARILRRRHQATRSNRSAAISCSTRR